MDHIHQQRAASVRWSRQLCNDIATAPDLATAASHLGASDIPVFPCVPGGKRPLTAHGFQDASSDGDVINFWWRRQPDANIGVPTGSVGGIDVVDVDVHESDSAFSAFEQARRAGFVEGWAWLVRTPSGGLHTYLLRTSEREQRSWQVPTKHINFRGAGGYIIVPPSRVTGDDGASRNYRPIAASEHHQPLPVDAAGLRGFLDPPTSDASPDGHAFGWSPPRQARRLGGVSSGGRPQRRPVLGGLPDGRGRARSQYDDLDFSVRPRTPLGFPSLKRWGLSDRRSESHQGSTRHHRLDLRTRLRR